MIIVLLSISCVLFFFWLVSRLISADNFDTLPDWLVSAFSSVWSWLVTALSGVGVFTLRYFTSRDATNPNFLKWIMITVFSILIFIVIVLAIYFLATLVAQRPNQRSELRNKFVISNETGGVDWAFKYTISGRYGLKNKTLHGFLDHVSIRPTRSDVYVKWIEFLGCHSIGGGPQWDTYPKAATSAQTVDVYKQTLKDATTELAGGSFEIPLPAEILAQRPWLCARIWSENKLPDGKVVAGMVPAHSLSYESIKF
jgi:heme/copper-type cytochrome/quinol oxidase subunit 2